MTKHILIKVTDSEHKQLALYKARHGLTWTELLLEAIEPCEPEDVPHWNHRGIN